MTMFRTARLAPDKAAADAIGAASLALLVALAFGAP